MASLILQNLDRFQQITNPDGTPTLYFIRFIQQRGGAVFDIDVILQQIETLLGNEIIAGDALTGGGKLADGDVTIDHVPSLVSPGSYTSADITVDEFGHVTAAADGTGGGGVPEAPVDGILYGRKDAAWEAVPGGGGGVPEAPVDGIGYRRKDAGWEEDPLQDDAPQDGQAWIRKDGAWVTLDDGGGTPPPDPEYALARRWRIVTDTVGTSLEAGWGEIVWLGEGSGLIPSLGVASASSEQVGFEAAKAFDGMPGTGWKAVTASAAGSWIEFNFTDPQTVRFARLRSRTGFWADSPVAFSVEFYDGTSWQNVGSFTRAWSSDFPWNFTIEKAPPGTIPPVPPTDDAPSDGNLYGRKDAAWELVPGLQASLDLLDASPGAIIYRGATLWDGLTVGSTGDVLAVASGLPAWRSVSALLDLMFSNTQGAVLYRGSAAWAALGPGSANDVLQTKGAGQNPVWATANSIVVEGGAPWLTIYSNAAITNPTASIVVNVSAFSEFQVIGYQVTAAANSNRGVVFSVDGGVTFYQTNGDYAALAATGVQTNNFIAMSHSTQTTAARNFGGEVRGSNINGTYKNSNSVSLDSPRFFLASQAPITHIRIQAMTGSNALTNMTGGAVSVIARA